MEEGLTTWMQWLALALQNLRPGSWLIDSWLTRVGGSGRHLRSDPFYCFHAINSSDLSRIDIVADLCSYEDLDVLSSGFTLTISYPTLTLRSLTATRTMQVPERNSDVSGCRNFPESQTWFHS